ncbi:MAG TPA: hypothetical protein VLT10_00635 [Verrucomicrobiae bacterium]|nr:hypothetical protein [Verrucomicrobiae bacterium]
MAHGTIDNVMMLTMSIAMLTMVMSMLIMGVFWGFALLIISGVLTAVLTVFYSFQSAKCMCGCVQSSMLGKKGKNEETCECVDVNQPQESKLSQ